MAEDAVSCELVSGQKFPLTGKNTGNFTPVNGAERSKHRPRAVFRFKG